MFYPLTCGLFIPKQHSESDSKTTGVMTTYEWNEWSKWGNRWEVEGVVKIKNKKIICILFYGHHLFCGLRNVCFERAKDAI